MISLTDSSGIVKQKTGAEQQILPACTVVRPYWNVPLVGISHSTEDQTPTVLPVHRAHDQALPVRGAQASSGAESRPPCRNRDSFDGDLGLDIHKAVPAATSVGALQLLDAVQLLAPDITAALYTTNVTELDEDSLALRVVN